MREALDNIHNANKKMTQRGPMNQVQLRSYCTPGLPNDAVQLEILHSVNTPSLAKLQHTRIVVLGSSVL